MNKSSTERYFVPSEQHSVDDIAIARKRYFESISNSFLHILRNTVGEKLRMRYDSNKLTYQQYNKQVENKVSDPKPKFIAKIFSYFFTSEWIPHFGRLRLLR
jgi:hypothetical protein